MLLKIKILFPWGHTDVTKWLNKLRKSTQISHAEVQLLSEHKLSVLSSIEHDLHPHVWAVDRDFSARSTALEGKNNIDSVTWTRSTFSHEATCCQCVFRVTNLPPLDLLHPKATFKYKKNQAKPNRRLSTKLDCYFFKQEKTKAMAAQRNLWRQDSEMWRYPGGTPEQKRHVALQSRNS